jgi:hypothetical protein
MPPGDPDALEAAAARLGPRQAGVTWRAPRPGLRGRFVRRPSEVVPAADQQEAFHAALSTSIAQGEAPLAQVAGAVRSYAGYLRAAQQRVAAANSAADLAQPGTRPGCHARAAEHADGGGPTRQRRRPCRRDRGRCRQGRERSVSPDGPLRSTIEEVHTALGFAGADGILWAAGKGSEAAQRAPTGARHRGQAHRCCWSDKPPAAQAAEAR